MRMFRLFLSLAFLLPVSVFAETLQTIRAKAQQGNSLAQYNLGTRYARGAGVAKDDKKAILWYRKAAKQGNANAQYNLGVRYGGYVLGTSISRDDQQAYKWLSLATAGGHANSKAFKKKVAGKLTAFQILAIEKELTAQLAGSTQKTDSTMITLSDSDSDPALEQDKQSISWSTSLDKPIKMDERDRQVLSKLSPADYATFSRKFHQAMALYYDNAYPLSLPLFRDIAHRVDTLDVLHFYGLAAQRSGKNDLAISKYLAILERHPKLHQVRMDLAMAYLQKGDKISAKAEIQKIQEEDPAFFDQEKNTVVHNNLNRMSKRLFSTFQVMTGLQTDSNINAQPDRSIENLTTEKKDGLGVPMSASLDLLYDFGKKQGAAVWRNNLSFYRISNQDASVYDYSQVDFRSGLEHYGAKWQLKLPLGLIDRQFGHTSLSNSWYLAPEASYALKKDLSLKFAYRVEGESSDINADQDNTTHALTLSPNWFFKHSDTGWSSLLSLQTLYTNRDAQGSQYAYQDWGVGSSWFFNLDSGIGALLRAQFLDRDYDGNSGTNLSLDTEIPSERQDQRYSIMAMVSQKLMDHYSISANYAYTHNISNDQRFEYDKSVFGVNLGITLNF